MVDLCIQAKEVNTAPIVKQNEIDTQVGDDELEKVMFSD